MSISRPWSMIATRSQRRSASSMRWVVRNTVVPRARMPRTSSQIARRACGSRPVVSSSRNTSSGSFISESAMSSRCFCPPDRVMNQASRFSPRPSCSSSAIAVDGRPVQRRPQADGLAHRDSLLQLGVLELHADPLLERVGLPHRIEPEHRDDAAIGRAQPLDAFHRGGLAGAVRADQPEDLGRLHREGHVVHGHGAAVGLAQAVDANGGRRGAHPATWAITVRANAISSSFTRWPMPG